jgi:hypothetical protein
LRVAYIYVLAAILKPLRVIILLFILCSCDTNRDTRDQPTKVDTTIRLIDSLGAVTLALPSQTDTFFTWIRKNDCGKFCEEGKYRFQPKNLRIFEESGFYWTGQPEDSVNQLTISQNRPDTIIRNNDSFAIKRYTYFKEVLLSNPETANVISDTIEKIGDRYFCVFKIADLNKQKNVSIRRLIAFTSIGGNSLQFRYELLTQKQDSILARFFDNSIKNLETVRIIDGG